MYSFSRQREPETVSQLLARIKGSMQDEFPAVWITGEIRNFKKYGVNGHRYFELHDGREKALVNCALFRTEFERLAFQAGDGQLVELYGRLNVFEPQGKLQVAVRKMRLVGEGALYQKYLRLRAALEEEGLFDPSRKKPIPDFPFTIGIVTSLQAAALRDVMKRLRENAPHVRTMVYHTSVQGGAAEVEIVAALEEADSRREADVILLVRGGGSLTDLWCFNSERVARAIAAMAIPVVSGVGHETDFTIADQVSDRSTPTPTAAADCVTSCWRGIRERIDGAGQRVRRSLGRRVALCRSRLRIEGTLKIAAWKMLDSASARCHALGNVQELLQDSMNDREQLVDTSVDRLRFSFDGKSSQSEKRVSAAELKLAKSCPQPACFRSELTGLLARLDNAVDEVIRKFSASTQGKEAGLSAAVKALHAGRERTERAAAALRDGPAGLTEIKKSRFTGVLVSLAGVTPPIDAMGARLAGFSSRLDLDVRRNVYERRHAADIVERKLVTVRPEPSLPGVRLRRLESGLGGAVRLILVGKRGRCELLLQRLEGAGVSRVLERGFAIVTDSAGRIVRDASLLKAGETLSVRFGKGEVAVRVLKVAGGSQPVSG